MCVCGPQNKSYIMRYVFLTVAKNKFYWSRLLIFHLFYKSSV